MQEIVITDQDALEAINQITCDDFCEDLDCEAAFNPERLTAREKIAHEKLILVYRIAHSFLRSHSCFRFHDDWRKLPGELTAKWKYPPSETERLAEKEG